MGFCGTCSRPPCPPCPPTPVPVQTQASFWACMDRKMRIHHPQLPGRSSAFLIPYPPFSFRGWIAAKGGLEVGGALPLRGRLVYLQHSTQGSLLPLLQHRAEVTGRRGEPRLVATAPAQHCAHKAGLYLWEKRTTIHLSQLQSRVYSSQLQVNGQTIKCTAQKLSPKTWHHLEERGGSSS